MDLQGTRLEGFYSTFLRVMLLYAYYYDEFLISRIFAGHVQQIHVWQYFLYPLNYCRYINWSSHANPLKSLPFTFNYNLKSPLGCRFLLALKISFSKRTCSFPLCRRLFLQPNFFGFERRLSLTSTFYLMNGKLAGKRKLWGLLKNAAVG